MSVKLILFDLDETIAPDEETNAVLATEIATDVAARYDVRAERLVTAIGWSAEALWQQGEAAAYAQRIGISAWEGLWGPFGPSKDPMLEALHDFVPGYRHRVWAAVLAVCGLHDEHLATELAARFLGERRARQQPYPWSREVLEGMRAHYRLGMITNGAPDLQRLKLAGTGLEELFDPLVVSGDLGIGKPEGGIFAHALATAGVTPDEAVMVGDSWYRDVMGALASGLGVVWLNPHDVPLPARLPGSANILTAPDLRALPALLARHA